MAAERPNVVLMLADNLGFGDIGAYGGGEILGTPSPNLDSSADSAPPDQDATYPSCPWRTHFF